MGATPPSLVWLPTHLYTGHPNSDLSSVAEEAWLPPHLCCLDQGPPSLETLSCPGPLPAEDTREGTECCCWHRRDEARQPMALTWHPTWAERQERCSDEENSHCPWGAPSRAGFSHLIGTIIIVGIYWALTTGQISSTQKHLRNNNIQSPHWGFSICILSAPIDSLTSLIPAGHSLALWLPEVGVGQGVGDISRISGRHGWYFLPTSSLL